MCVCVCVCVCVCAHVCTCVCNGWMNNAYMRKSNDRKNEYVCYVMK